MDRDLGRDRDNRGGPPRRFIPRSDGEVTKMGAGESYRPAAHALPPHHHNPRFNRSPRRGDDRDRSPFRGDTFRPRGGGFPGRDRSPMRRRSRSPPPFRGGYRGGYRGNYRGRGRGGWSPRGGRSPLSRGGRSPFRDRSPLRDRSPMRDRSPISRARSPMSRARSPMSRARSPASNARSSVKDAPRSPSLRARSPARSPMRQRSPSSNVGRPRSPLPMRNRSPPPVRRFSPRRDERPRSPIRRDLNRDIPIPRYRSRSPNDRNRAPARERSPFRSNRDLSPPRDPRGGQGWRSPVRGRYRGLATNSWRRDRRSISPVSGKTSDCGSFNSRAPSPRASYRRAPYTGPDLIRDRPTFRRDDRDVDIRDGNRAPYVRARDTSPSKDSGRDTGSIVSTPRGRSAERSPESRDPMRRLSIRDDQPPRVSSPVEDNPPPREASQPVRQERPRSSQHPPQQPPAKPFRPPTGPKEEQGFRQRRFDNDNNYSRPPFLGPSANAISVRSPNSALARENSNASNTTSNSTSSQTTGLNANATSFEPAKQPAPSTPVAPPTGPAAYRQPSPAFERQLSPASQRQPSPAGAPTGPASQRQSSPAATSVPTGPKALMPKAPRGGGWGGRGGRQSFSYDRRPIQDVTNMANNANNTNTRWGAAPPRQAQPQALAFTPATPKNPSPSPTPARTPSISGASTSVPTQSPRNANVAIPTGPRASISSQGGRRGGGDGMDWKPTGPAVSVTPSTVTSYGRGPAEPIYGVTNISNVLVSNSAKAPQSSGWGPAPAEETTTIAKPQITTSTSSGWAPTSTDTVNSATPGSRSSSISSAPPPHGLASMSSSHASHSAQHNAPSFHGAGWNVKPATHFASTTSSAFPSTSGFASSTSAFTPRPHIHPALASLTPIIPGGKLDPSMSLTGGDPKPEARLVRAREEEERIRRELADKEANLRRTLRGWERAERESWVSGVRSEVAGEALAVLTGEGSGGGAF